MHGKPFGRDEKSQVNKRRMSLTLQSSLLCENESLCTGVMFFPKKAFSLPYFPTQIFYSFSCFLQILALIVQQHVPLIVLGMLRDTSRQVLNPYLPISNPNTAIVLYSGWKREKTRQCQGSGMEGGSATTWGAYLGQEK